MDNYILLNGGTDKSLKPECILHAADRIARSLGYKGSFVCLPSPDGSGFILAVTPSDTVPREDTERLFRMVAFDTESPAYDLDGRPLFVDSDDNDLSFLEHIPAPEEEIGSIWLRFRIDKIKAEEPIARMRRLLDSHELDIEVETDGLAVYISHNGVLDLFYDVDCEYIDGEIDATYAGAGVYKEAFELAGELAADLSGNLEFAPGERPTYPTDRDFNKLRELFYESLRQQLVFAVADDRDGLQAYIGWGVDTYEPAEKPGSIVTFLGRYNIERLLAEIETYGFRAVADNRFLVRNRPYKGADEYVKTALSLLWTATTFRVGVFADDAKSPGGIAANNIEEALRLDPFIRVPYAEYLSECAILRRQPVDTGKCRTLDTHYEIGYLLEKIYYGFGSYLRKFRLDGDLGYTEIIQGEHILFSSFANPSLSLECRIEYPEGEAQPDDGFFSGFDTIRQFDIGGAAFCRYAERRDDANDDRGGFAFKARAEILIRDERYTFLFSTDSAASLDDFTDTVSGCRAVEDVEDPTAEDTGEKSRAWGACFFRRDAADGYISYGDAMKRLMPLLEDYSERSVRMNFYLGNGSPACSKIGGTPFVPEGFEIPVVPETEYTVRNGSAGKPLDFVAQINFAEFEPPPDFPDSGLLQLYAIMPDNGFPKSFASPRQVYFRVLYFEDTGKNSPDINGQELRVRFRGEPMTVTSCDYRFEEAVYNPLAHMTGELSPEDFGRLYDRFYYDGSRIGGYPVFSGNDRRHPGFEELDTLLLQLDSEDLAGFTGIADEEGPWLLNLFINRDALINRDFSEVMLVVTKDGDADAR